MHQIVDSNGTVWRWNPVWKTYEKVGQLTPPERDPAKAIEGMKALMECQNGELRLPF
jgi:hypothetical protein